MHRLAVLALLLLSLPLMANTCEFHASTGDGHDCRKLENDRDRDCEGVQVVVDTTIPSSGSSSGQGGGNGSGGLVASDEASAVVARALAVSLVASAGAPPPDGATGPGGEGAPPAVGSEGRAAGPSPGRLALAAAGPLAMGPALHEEPLELEELAPIDLPAGSLVAVGIDSPIPEPGAALLFATGGALLALGLRHHPR